MDKKIYHEKIVRRISMLRVFNDLGIEHDGHFAECPKCKRKSLRYLQNANKVKCARCFKRPATNIDLVMRVKKMRKDEAIEYINNLCAHGKANAHMACAGKNDVQDWKEWCAENKCAHSYIELAHNHKNKFRHESIAITHAIILSIILHWGESIDNAPSGLCDIETAKWGQENMGLVVLHNKRMKALESFLRIHFYASDIHKLPVWSKNGELFCFNRNIIIPFYQDDVLVGIVAVDVSFERDSFASLTPYAHFSNTESEDHVIATKVSEAIILIKNNKDTWMPIKEGIDMQNIVKGLV